MGSSPFTLLADFVGSAWALGATPSDRWRIFWSYTKNLRVRMHLAAHHPSSVYSVRTIHGPLYVRDNFGDITNLVGVVYRNVYRADSVLADGAILDIGANIGLAAACFRHYHPGRAIYCFEPLEEAAALIPLNCPGAQVEQVALGEHPGRVRLQVDRDAVMASQIPCAWPTRLVEHEVVPLDQFMRRERLDRIALIKIDVEGMENEVLRGSRAALQNTDRIIVETHGWPRHVEAVELLRESGFLIESQPFGPATGMIFAARIRGRM